MAGAPVTITASDPVTALATAAMNLGTAYFTYLNSPAGQQFAKDENAIFEKFNSQVAALFDHAQAQIAKQTTGV
jgi:hypothetical protein